MLQAHVK